MMLEEDGERSGGIACGIGITLVERLEKGANQFRILFDQNVARGDTLP